MKFTPILAPPGKPGTNTKAGDQLKAAAAQAAFNNDLRIIYDVGGAPSAGGLPAHTVSPGAAHSRPTFSERARNDPQLITLVHDLAEMQLKRRQLESERTELTKRRNLTQDKSKMKEWSDLESQKEKEYQAHLKAIFDQTERVQKRHREIDTKVEDAPPPQVKPKGNQ